MPRYCAFEPRPLRVAPAPFLCAMVSGLHAADEQLGVGLAVTVLAAVVLPAPELEDDDLLAAVLRSDLRGDAGADDERSAHLDGLAAEEENLAELDRGADFAR